MTFALFTIFLVAIMPIVCAGIAKAGMFKVHPREGGFDNRNPRDWLAKQEGYRKWANAAQQNCWEALPFFAAAVIVNHILGGAGLTANVLAIAFVLLRVLFVYLYLTGKQGIRSLVWIAAFAVNIAIFFLPVLFQYL
ncbi:MAG: MAPEG family protein [Casimicrobium sp.]